jgi:hypothetical protein
VCGLADSKLVVADTALRKRMDFGTSGVVARGYRGYDEDAVAPALVREGNLLDMFPNSE